MRILSIALVAMVVVIMAVDQARAASPDDDARAAVSIALALHRPADVISSAAEPKARCPTACDCGCDAGGPCACASKSPAAAPRSTLMPAATSAVTLADLDGEEASECPGGNCSANRSAFALGGNCASGNCSASTASFGPGNYPPATFAQPAYSTPTYAPANYGQSFSLGVSGSAGAVTRFHLFGRPHRR